jgi:DNA invertase Pin-like site-specific DNA recombinase
MAVRAALYVRVSAWDKAPDTQLATLRKFAAARGWATTESVDDGVSGTDVRRPALDALFIAARNGEIDVVVCAALDRVVGRPEDLFRLIHELQSIGVDLEVLEQGQSRVQA